MQEIELKIMQMLENNLTKREIAKELGISHHTVNAYIVKISKGKCYSQVYKYKCEL